MAEAIVDICLQLNFSPTKHIPNSNAVAFKTFCERLKFTFILGGNNSQQYHWNPPKSIQFAMDDEAETYKLWRIRKTVMQVCYSTGNIPFILHNLNAFNVPRSISPLNSCVFSLSHIALANSWVTIVATWWHKMNWTKHWSNSKSNLVINRGKLAAAIHHNANRFVFKITL